METRHMEPEQRVSSEINAKLSATATSGASQNLASSPRRTCTWVALEDRLRLRRRKTDGHRDGRLSARRITSSPHLFVAPSAPRFKHAPLGAIVEGRIGAGFADLRTRLGESARERTTLSCSGFAVAVSRSRGPCGVCDRRQGPGPRSRCPSSPRWPARGRRREHRPSERRRRGTQPEEGWSGLRSRGT